MDALQFNKVVSQHCKESGGDCYQRKIQGGKPINEEI